MVPTPASSPPLLRGPPMSSIHRRAAAMEDVSGRNFEAKPSTKSLFEYAPGSQAIRCWREADSNHRFRVTRPRFQNRLKSPLPDSAPTEVRRELEPTPRGRLAPSAGPMVRIPVPSSSESGANSRSVEETRGPEMGELSPLSSIYDLVSHHRAEERRHRHAAMRDGDVIAGSARHRSD